VPETESKHFRSRSAATKHRASSRDNVPPICYELIVQTSESCGNAQGSGSDRFCKLFESDWNSAFGSRTRDSRFKPGHDEKVRTGSAWLERQIDIGVAPGNRAGLRHIMQLYANQLDFLPTMPGIAV